MKEIKFRLWDKEKNRMIYPVYQSRALKNQARHECLHLYPDSSCSLFDNDKEDMIFAIQPDETNRIMQFTGLKDNNGKEIYEGDIVSIIINNVNKGKYEIKWNEYKWYPFSEGIPPIYTGTKLEVIGNIYENPDLLTFEKTKGAE